MTGRRLVAAARVLIAAAAITGTITCLRLPANEPPARPWHYPCVMHRAYGFEDFTPARLFWKGDCLQ